ncbi:hypothetical protein HK101_008172, partial [Irineochytrium annulatum]
MVRPVKEEWKEQQGKGKPARLPAFGADGKLVKPTEAAKPMKPSELLLKAKEAAEGKRRKVEEREQKAREVLEVVVSEDEDTEMKIDDKEEKMTPALVRLEAKEQLASIAQ